MTVKRLKQRKGIVKSKYLDVDTNEASKFETLTQQQLIKTYTFHLFDEERDKRYEIKLTDDKKQCKENNVQEIQSVLAKRNDMDGILLALSLKPDESGVLFEFNDVFTSSKDFEESKRRNPQLITLVNGKEPEVNEKFQDKIFYNNDIFGVDPEILMNDTEKQKEVIQMNQKAKEIFFEIFQKLWSNVITYENSIVFD